ncbi:hypothetical protein HanXRQr2_Chr09g0367861 [Helianthus annuus]|uniref:Uncharacterized protein n=1 Tax=Helianthus annuus TaxID=4232 RepID=A0A9K3I3I9_HELAN|nr:hypothetical protein HanXRQr2_Chr09g0367861 [Helianthus annuus]KAJ0540905.1 hypothetical protein HanHA89_Chr09g0322271 [Helianthus annuus]KAJ0706004.1 hypothetical protein HanLR1_Chr09g0301961 [Helianthus annuus]KAJ0891478.1 hypothetical protein HanPSC8_Chr09g0354291 [Helianthus annuus]
MGAKKDMGLSYSRLTQEEVETFCEEWGIYLSFNPVAPGLDKSIYQYPSGSIALYCRHFKFSNLRHPFTIFVLNVLEYYRISFGQIHPHGLFKVRILRFCVGHWVMIVTVYVPAIFSLGKNVTTLGSWKDRFFWVSKSIVPFKLVWRHPDAILNELEPSESELDGWLLKALKECPSQLRPFPQHLLFLMGVSVLWDKPDRDPVLSTFVILCVFIFFLCLSLFVFIR